MLAHPLRRRPYIETRMVRCFFTTEQIPNESSCITVPAGLLIMQI